MLITLTDYLGNWKSSPDVTEEVLGNAKKLLETCDLLAGKMRAEGVIFKRNPKTGSGVSGSLYGGFRPKDCQVGAANSAHKKGLAVDRFDPENTIDDWCLQHQDVLAECGIYLESPAKTLGWSHWTIRVPGSGKRVFQP